MSLDLSREQAERMLGELLSIEEAAKKTIKIMDFLSDVTWRKILFRMTMQVVVFTSGLLMTYSSYGDYFLWNVPMEVPDEQGSMYRFVFLSIQCILSSGLVLMYLAWIVMFMTNNSLTSGFGLARELNLSQLRLLQGIVCEFLNGDEKKRASEFVTALSLPESNNLRISSDKKAFIDYLATRGITVDKALVDSIFIDSLGKAIATLREHLSVLMKVEPLDWKKSED